jgi:hypothetical protein
VQRRLLVGREDARRLANCSVFDSEILLLLLLLLCLM